MSTINLSKAETGTHEADSIVSIKFETISEASAIADTDDDSTVTECGSKIEEDSNPFTEAQLEYLGTLFDNAPPAQPINTTQIEDDSIPFTEAQLDYLDFLLETASSAQPINTTQSHPVEKLTTATLLPMILLASWLGTFLSFYYAFDTVTIHLPGFYQCGSSHFCLDYLVDNRPAVLTF